MRETVKSLRAYLILVGIMLLCGAYASARDYDGDLLSIITFTIFIIFSTGYFIAGIRLHTFLSSSTTYVNILIICTIIIQLIGIAVMCIYETKTMPYIVASFRILICWYIIVNVNRLSKEMAKCIDN